jgi:hypothetical protein
LKRHLGGHLDGCAGYLAAAHCEVHVPGEESTAVDEAREQQRAADDGFLRVGVAAVLARRNGPHAFALGRSIDAADIRRERVERLGKEHRTACLTQLLLALQPLVEFWLAREHADRTHERIHRNRDSRHVLRTSFKAAQLPTNDVRIGKDIS